MSARLAIAVGLASLCGCATGAGNAPGFLLRGLTYEGRLMLLDAEENFAAAQVRAEQAHAELDRAEDLVSEARSRVSRFEDDDKPWTKEARAQLTYAQVTVEWAAEAVRVAGADAGCVRVRYELAKVESARKTSVDGAAEVQPDAWASEARECEEKLEEQRAGLHGLQEKRFRAKAAWDETKTLLARQSRRPRPGPFVE